MSDGVAGLLILLALLAAILGYGLVGVRLLAGAHVRPPGALVAGTGTALFCWLGGWLVAFEAWSRGAALALLALGIGALALSARELRARLAGARPAALPLALVGLAAALSLLRALGAIRSPFVTPCDDWAAYFHLPKRLLETGGLVEPFSMRRLGVLGVGPLLQSFFFPLWPTRSGAIADVTLGGLLVWGGARAAVALGAAGRASSVTVESGALLALVVSFAIPLANGSPALLPMGGTLVLLCLAAELDRGSETLRGARTRALAWGALAAFVVGVRTTNIAFAGLVGLAGLGLALARHDGAAARRWLLAALAFALALAPWCLASWRSSATPFYPLVQGNYRFAGALSAPLSLAETLSFVGGSLWANRLWFLLVLAFLVGRRRGWAGSATLAAVAGVGTVAVTALALTGLHSFDVLRYSAPLVFAALVFLAALWLGGPRASRAQLAIAGLATALWLFMPIEIERHSGGDAGEGPERIRSSPARGIARHANGWWFAARESLRHGLSEPAIPGAGSFSAAQASLGSGARILSAVSKPFFWRFDRHVIHIVDCPGQASPPPGMPFFEGPEALARYLLDAGYTHLAFSPPQLDPCLYSLANWTKSAESGVYLWEQWAPYFLDFLKNEQALAAELGSVYRSRDVIVVDLRRARGD